MNGQMNAVEITRYGGRFEYNSRPVPRAAGNEVLLKVEASGLCSTDLHILEGRMDLGTLPRVPGHETAGIVIETGADVKGWEAGARAVVAVDTVCGSCRHCLTGHPQRCRNRVRIGFERDGGHAEYLAVPANVLVPLPDSIGSEEAAILPDAVACMYHCLLSQGGLTANDRVLILGAGGLGIHGVQIAVLAGAQVIATSRNPARLKAVERYGGIPVNPSTGDLRGVVGTVTGGQGVDVAADCIGTVESVREAMSLVRPGGKVLIVAYVAEEFSVPSLDMMLNEKELVGCRGSTLEDLREVVELTRTGKIEPVVGMRFHLSEIEKAAGALRDGAMVGRIVLTR
jgi:2-desacetyl-2-hydroxyethyl bacteriochlorophyllide A dehydrogenase